MRSLLFAFLFCPLLGYAESGSKLLTSCRPAVERMNGGTASDPMQAMFCIAYVRGVTDSYETIKDVYPQVGVYCEPYGVNTEQRIRITHKYLETHPEILHQEASSLVLVALREAFPCKN